MSNSVASDTPVHAYFLQQSRCEHYERCDGNPAFHDGLQRLVCGIGDATELVGEEPYGVLVKRPCVLELQVKEFGS